MGWTCYDAWCNMKQLIRVLIFTLLSVCTAETVLSTVRILITLENNKISNEKSLLYMYVCKYNYLFPAIYSRSLPIYHACTFFRMYIYIYIPQVELGPIKLVYCKNTNTSTQLNHFQTKAYFEDFSQPIQCFSSKPQNIFGYSRVFKHLKKK